MQDRAPLPSPAGSTIATAVDRLGTEFGGRVTARALRRAVQRARRDLAGAPAGALPELVERLARERLRETAAGRR